MKIVVTGGAGFIGSHIAAAYVADGHEVVVLDDLSTGFRQQIPSGATLIEGTISDLSAVEASVAGAQLVFHEAATRGVLKSVQDPVGTDAVNTRGTLNVLVAARDAGVQRVILASSSSVYGGVAPLPTSEDAPLTPRSPYAVTKVAGEHYARVFSELYGLETVSLRYFNVFGPRQRPDSQYAAVIPLFIEALSSDIHPQIHGDGHQSRDFTYIDNVVKGNLAAAEAPAGRVSGRVYNVAAGGRHSLLDLLHELGDIMGVDPAPDFTDPRAGDVRDSSADISLARTDLGYEPDVSFRDGLVATVEWFAKTRRVS
jgi:UDP-glucose 4-epimerase